ncbi:uncharacterized protein DUF397 [Saccharopolyspora erythraea NRRL 2338]|uniref:Uncharacterized protein n=2 Tax=Saccharopolyspora erythraea TaxID=1836 RepID=A4F921_SACEN|nr:DUF397 domain-containing protein [Saccharopolyspora erythraea]EQD87204.1 regulator [Saccharopolyspora erythraea D]PFG94339.1 uncharacterized protein DUF397 [Saccharopolyspora erythraea NRRL 2338]QRK91110.1 DUF397 domain-containing protein [Saccharopolyspora erythraea]QUH00429.1 DUF397 domain-containing protein [Saccharopolyspora erythraea]CAM00546.1 hypothetical protein SACE_1220 [Saccharopolyspora erythraea NRRL 2338]
MEYITDWRTSTRTQGQGQCVEVGFGAQRVGVRDTKNRAGGHFTVASRRWQEFVSGVKRGIFDA